MSYVEKILFENNVRGHNIQGYSLEALGAIVVISLSSSRV